MRKMLFVVSALAALSLLAPSAGVAAGAYNQIGMYTDVNDFNTASINIGASTPFTVYLVMTNPYNVDLDMAVPTVSGFECQIILPVTGFFKLNATLPANSLNVGTEPDWIVGFGEPQSVSGANNAITLVSFGFMTLDTDPKAIFLAPSSVPSIPGVMALADGVDPGILLACYPSSGDFASAVFGINDTVVATEDSSWGDVKALFR